MKSIRAKKIAIVGKYMKTVSSLPESLMSVLAETKGLELTSDVQTADVVLTFDCDKETAKKIRTLKAGVRKVLVVSEPKVVWPFGSKAEVHQLFDEVAWIGRPPNGLRTVFPFPHSLVVNEELICRERRSDSTIPIVNANKFSAIDGELYSLRRMTAARISGVGLYGVGWQRPLLGQVREIIYCLSQALVHKQSLSRTWLHSALSARASRDKAVPDKAEFLAKFSRCIVIENSLEALSEKLLDALIAGTYPIYVGPAPRDYGLPDFLCIHAEPNVASIEDALLRSQEVDLGLWRIEVLNWLNASEIVISWLDANVYRQVLLWAAKL